MPLRRAFLTGLLPALAASAASAQESRPRRLRTDDPGVVMGSALAPAAPAPAQGVQRAELAPMPNSRWEAPRATSGDPDAPRLTPGMISPTMPGRGMAQGNSQASINDRLFRPAPGAHLHIPVNW